MTSKAFSVRKLSGSFEIAFNWYTVICSGEALKQCLDDLLGTKLPLDPGEGVSLTIGLSEMTLPTRDVPDVIQAIENVLNT